MSPPRMLLVDDSRVVHGLARVSIEVFGGWQMLSVDSGAEAVPIVFLTAEDDPGERERLAAMVLRKPFEVSALAGDIAEMLDRP